MSGMKKLVEEWLKRSAEYTSKLKGGARDVLSEYQDDPAFINEVLRGQNSRPHAVEHLKDVLPPVKEAFRDAPPVPEGGLSVFRVGPLDAYPSGGLQVRDPGLVSTSRDWSVPDNFLGYYDGPESLKMRVNVPEGSRALDLSSLNKEWSPQQEVLLHPGFFSSPRADSVILNKHSPWFSPEFDDPNAVAMYLGERNYSPDLQWLTREGFRAGGLVQ